MTIELFLALLANDAYHRGYDPDLPNLSESEAEVIGDQLGNFRIINTSSQVFLNADKTIGFYAVAYEELR